MKIKILLLLLFISSYMFAQTWSQVGTTQFSTNFAINSELAFNNSGVPYVVYENVTGNGIYVMKFNGTSWVDVGSGAISTENYNNITIKINPVTNDPWIVLKSSAGGALSNLDIFRFDGNFWVTEGQNIGGGFYSYGIQLQFSNIGTPRIAGMISGGGTDRAVSFHTKSGTTWTNIVGEESYNARVDFYDFNTYLLADSHGRIRKYYVDGSQWVSILPLSSVDYREVSGIVGTNFFATNVPNSKIKVGDAVNIITQPTGVTNNTHSILKFRESTADNNYYLMYSDSTEDLVFQKYKSNDTWTVLPSVGITTNTSDFFAKMEMNPVNGSMYTLYKDGAKLSVKKFNIQPTLTKYYVNTNISGGNGSGDSWANAMSSLTDALSASGTNTTDIWIAEGTYKPHASDRSTSFVVDQDNIQIYGGFNGTESSITERDLLNNVTILSGDLNDDDIGVDFNNTRIDNSYHVVQINANDVLLDGLHINDGHANGASSDSYAGGLLIDGESQNPTIKNCEFNKNVGLNGGAVRAYYITNSNVTLENCIFNLNVSKYGSGLYVLVHNNSNVTLDMVNCLFTNNVSKDQNAGNRGYTGSSVWARANGANSNLTTTITNCTFTKNLDMGTQSGSQRGTLALSKRTDGNSTHTATINNSIFYNNVGAGGTSTTLAVNRGHAAFPTITTVNNSIDEDGFSNLIYLTNTSSANPLFTNTANDFTLQTGSPAIDTGLNTYIPSGITTDLLGNQRIFNTTVDMGCYEFGSGTVTSYTLTTNVVGQGVLTPVSGTVYNDGDIAIITATPSTGWIFDGWSGDLTGTTNPTQLTMDAHKSVTATFSQITYILTTNTVGQGTITPANGTVYNEGNIATITATPAAGWIFDGWSGDLTGTTTPAQLTMDAHKSVTATFSQICIVNFTDANFKNALVSNTTINTNGDTEIQCTEAVAFNGYMSILNLSITNLDGIEAFVNITNIDASSNPLTHVDFSMNNNLVSIEFADNNMLSSIVFPNNPSNLISILFINCTSLVNLDVSALSELTGLTMGNTQIANLDLSLNSELTGVSVLNTNLTSLDLSQNGMIFSVQFGGASATSLDLRNGNLSNIAFLETDLAPNLTCIFVDDSTLTGINLNGWDQHVNNNFVETEAECSAIVAVEDFDLINFNVYPNPTTNFITIESTQNIKHVSIYTVLGQEVIKSNEKIIDVSHLENGMYLVKIVLESGKISTKRFMIN